MYPIPDRAQCKYRAPVVFTLLLLISLQAGCSHEGHSGSSHSMSDQSESAGDAKRVTNHSEMSQKMNHGEAGMHQHSLIDVSHLKPLPSLTLTITKDPMGGWNIHAPVQHFQYVPERVNGDPIDREGHAHLFVDGKKVARLYSEWFYLSNLTPGEHTVSVQLNAHNHHVLGNGTSPIEVTATIQQP